MNHEVATPDPLSHLPIDPAVMRLLGDRHGFSEAYLLDRSERQQQLVAHGLGKLSVAMDMSTPTALDPTPEIIHGEVPVYEPGSFEATYDEARATPTTKLAYDIALAEDVMSKLGPTNPLRNREGFDGGIALGKVVHLLETDFAALPEAEQRPEQRLTEGLLREELALLWRPTTPKKFEGNRHQAFMFDLSDPNLFNEGQIETLSEPDRWKLIGARLSDEAADVFEAIAKSPTAELSEKLTAGCRMTDMRIRSLRIQAGMSIGRVQKQELYDQIATLNTDYMSRLAAVWRHPSGRRGVKDGLLFELFVVGQERDELIKHGDVNKLVRLALPREDNIHPKIYPYVNRAGVQVNMSVDAVVEDTSGNFVQAYQVKAMSQRRYEELQAEREEVSGEVVYLADHTAMRFVDDYPLVSHGGIDLRPMMATKKRAA